MKRILVLIAALAAVGACSKRDMCISEARSELRTLTELTEQVRGNVVRGYAIGTEEELIERKYRCKVKQDDGSEMTQICTDVDTITRKYPVAIDLNAEKAKLASLEQRLAKARAQANQATAQCRAMYPE